MSAGVISREVQGDGTPMSKLLFVLRGHSPPNILILALFFQVFCIAMMNFALLHSYRDMSNCLLGYIIID